MRFSSEVVRPLRALFGGLDEPTDWDGLDSASTKRLIEALDAHGVLPLTHAVLTKVVRTDAETPNVEITNAEPTDVELTHREAPAAPSVRAPADREVPSPSRATSDAPAALRRAAEAAYMGSAAHAALRFYELGGILDDFGRIGLEALVLKGAALAETAYENVALRPMGDLDLLVREADLEAAGRVLEARGYRLAADEAPDLAHHWAYVRPLAVGVMSAVELHRRPLATPPFDRALPADELFARAEPARIADFDARIPCGADMLLHVAGHLVLQHARSERLIWVADVDRIARRLDAAAWREAVERAAAVGLAPAVADALAAAQHWFGTPVPPDSLSGLAAAVERDPRAVAAHRRVRARAPLGREGARRFTDLRGAKGLRRKVRYALAFAFPSLDYMRRHHGVDRASSLPIYYARRVARGLAHVASELIRRPAHGGDADEPPEQWMVESDAPSHLD